MDIIEWEEIVSIEYINPDQNEMVYDFSVEDVETFTTKDGIVVHNTLNSIDYNEKIVIRVDKKYYKVIKIGDFVEDISSRYEEKYKTFIEYGDQTYIKTNEQNEHFEIYAVDFDGNYKWCELQAVTKHLPLVEGKPDDLVKITLESGRSVTGTRAKSFLKFNEKIQKLQQCGGDSISIGDLVPIMKTFKIPNDEKLNTLNILINSKNLILDDMFGFFIGIFLANGICKKHFIKIKINKQQIYEKIYNFCDLYNIPYYIDDTITIYHKKLTELMYQLSSKNNSVPEFCYLANDTFIKALLDGYLSENGIINDNTFSYTTISNDLGDGIALLLKRFGIHTKIFEGANQCNTFTLKNYENFKYLTLTHKEKLWKMYKMMNKLERKQYEFQNNILEKVIKKEYIKSSHNHVYDLTVKDNINFILFNSISVADTFHSAGVSSKLNVNQGVPRLEEIISVTRYPKAPSQKIYLKDVNMASKFISKIAHLSFDKIVTDYKIYYNGDDIPDLSPWYLEIALDNYLLFEKDIEMIDIFTKLSIYYDKKNVEIIVYPDNETTTFKIYCKEHMGIEDYETLKWVVEQFDKITLLGVEYIQNAFYNDKDKNIQTNGSNMRQILSLPFVDSFKTMSNDIYDVYEIFGIESARFMIVQEINNIMEFNGITLDIRHIELLADVMTSRGFIMSTDRHGLKKNDGAQVLARASYEESVDMLAKAAIFSQIDELSGITANILVGQVAPSGTGDCELLMN